MEKYALSKIGMEKNIKEGGALFVGERCLRDFKNLFKNKNTLSYGYEDGNFLFTDKRDVYCKGEKIFSFPMISDSLHQVHAHDIENFLASYALCSTLSIQPDLFLTAIASFQKPPHRIEFIRTVNGVNYYDDSKGTNIDAVMRAVEGFSEKIILIAGGVDKGFPYTSWIELFKSKVRAIFAIGQAREKIKNDLGHVIPVIPCLSMEQAVEYAVDMAKEGENVLLSPGCSSFDMFKDYAHRGQEFQRIINAL
jgi:UDP-N-acetylmuramoylalanine--D-glutamate ligase